MDGAVDSYPDLSGREEAEMGYAVQTVGREGFRRTGPQSPLWGSRMSATPRGDFLAARLSGPAEACGHFHPEP
jgi:hypothetical protein